MIRFGAINVGDRFDSDDDLDLDGIGYVSRADVRRFRDHLNGLLGDTATATSTAPRPLAMPPAEALKAAEETVGRQAPATNARGYSDGVAPLRERMDAILRVADFLMKGGNA